MEGNEDLHSVELGVKEEMVECAEINTNVPSLQEKIQSQCTYVCSSDVKVESIECEEINPNVPPLQEKTQSQYTDVCSSDMKEGPVKTETVNDASPPVKWEPFFSFNTERDVNTWNLPNNLNISSAISKPLPSETKYSFINVEMNEEANMLNSDPSTHIQNKNPRSVNTTSTQAVSVQPLTGAVPLNIIGQPIPVEMSSRPNLLHQKSFEPVQSSSQNLSAMKPIKSSLEASCAMPVKTRPKIMISYPSVHGAKRVQRRHSTMRTCIPVHSTLNAMLGKAGTKTVQAQTFSQRMPILSQRLQVPRLPQTLSVQSLSKGTSVKAMPQVVSEPTLPQTVPVQTLSQGTSVKAMPQVVVVPTLPQTVPVQTLSQGTSVKAMPQVVLVPILPQTTPVQALSQGTSVKVMSQVVSVPKTHQTVKNSPIIQNTSESSEILQKPGPLIVINNGSTKCILQKSPYQITLHKEDKNGDENKTRQDQVKEERIDENYISLMPGIMQRNLPCNVQIPLCAVVSCQPIPWNSTSEPQLSLNAPIQSSPSTAKTASDIVLSKLKQKCQKRKIITFPLVHNSPKKVKTGTEMSDPVNEQKVDEFLHDDLSPQKPINSVDVQTLRRRTSSQALSQTVILPQTRYSKLIIDPLSGSVEGPEDELLSEYVEKGAVVNPLSVSVEEPIVDPLSEYVKGPGDDSLPGSVKGSIVDSLTKFVPVLPVKNSLLQKSPYQITLQKEDNNGDKNKTKQDLVKTILQMGAPPTHASMGKFRNKVKFEIKAEKQIDLNANESYCQDDEKQKERIYENDISLVPGIMQHNLPCNVQIPLSAVGSCQPMAWNSTSEPQLPLNATIQSSPSTAKTASDTVLSKLKQKCQKRKIITFPLVHNSPKKVKTGLEMSDPFNEREVDGFLHADLSPQQPINLVDVQTLQRGTSSQALSQTALLPLFDELLSEYVEKGAVVIPLPVSVEGPIVDPLSEYVKGPEDDSLPGSVKGSIVDSLTKFVSVLPVKNSLKEEVIECEEIDPIVPLFPEKTHSQYTDDCMSDMTEEPVEFAKLNANVPPLLEKTHSQYAEEFRSDVKEEAMECEEINTNVPSLPEKTFTQYIHTDDCRSDVKEEAVGEQTVNDAESSVKLEPFSCFKPENVENTQNLQTNFSINSAISKPLPLETKYSATKVEMDVEGNSFISDPSANINNINPGSFTTTLRHSVSVETSTQAVPLNIICRPIRDQSSNQPKFELILRAMPHQQSFKQVQCSIQSSSAMELVQNLLETVPVHSTSTTSSSAIPVEIKPKLIKLNASVHDQGAKPLPIRNGAVPLHSTSSVKPSLVRTKTVPKQTCSQIMPMQTLSQRLSVPTLSQRLPAPRPLQGTSVKAMPQVISEPTLPQTVPMQTLSQGTPVKALPQFVSEPTLPQTVPVQTLSQGTPVKAMPQFVSEPTLPQTVPMQTLSQGASLKVMPQEVLVPTLPQAVPVAGQRDYGNTYKPSHWNLMELPVTQNYIQVNLTDVGSICKECNQELSSPNHYVFMTCNFCPFSTLCIVSMTCHQTSKHGPRAKLPKQLKGRYGYLTDVTLPGGMVCGCKEKWTKNCNEMAHHLSRCTKGSKTCKFVNESPSMSAQKENDMLTVRHLPCDVTECESLANKSPDMSDQKENDMLTVHHLPCDVTECESLANKSPDISEKESNDTSTIHHFPGSVTECETLANKSSDMSEKRQDDKSFVIGCGLCDVKCSSYLTLTRHLRYFHPAKYANCLICLLCDIDIVMEGLLDPFYHLKRHQSKNHGGKHLIYGKLKEIESSKIFENCGILKGKKHGTEKEMKKMLDKAVKILNEIGLTSRIENLKQEFDILNTQNDSDDQTKQFDSSPRKVIIIAKQHEFVSGKQQNPHIKCVTKEEFKIITDKSYKESFSEEHVNNYYVCMWCNSKIAERAKIPLINLKSHQNNSHGGKYLIYGKWKACQSLHTFVYCGILRGKHLGTKEEMNIMFDKALKILSERGLISEKENLKKEFSEIMSAKDLIQLQDPLICMHNMCGKEFTGENRKSLIYAHLYEHWYPEETGHYCPQETKDDSSGDSTPKLRTKNEIDRFLRQILLSCNLCNKKPGKYQTVKTHLMRQHISVKCSVCRKILLSVSIQGHMQIHEQNGKWQCDKCGRVFKSCLSLQLHQRQVCTSLMCEFCGVIVKRRDYNNHIRVHENKQSFKCVECGKGFNTPVEKCKHIKYVHRKINVVRCFICRKKCRKENLPFHMRKCHRNNFECDICNKKFMKLKSLQTHLRRIHFGRYSNVKNSSGENNIFLCPLCGKTMNSSTIYRRHMESHNVPSPSFHCEICAKNFKSKSYLKEHNAISHPKNVNRYTCTYCHRNFPYKAYLTRHVKTKHLKQKNVQCTLCNYKCYDSYMLKSHMRFRHSN